jgi:hypothetical protein
MQEDDVMNAHRENQHSGRPSLDRRLEGIGWALFLIMLGGLGLIQSVPEGTWLVGTGLIMLGLNVARHVNGMRINHFTVVLGIMALLLGLAQLTGLPLPVLPVLLILIGADILIKTAARNETAAHPLSPQGIVERGRGEQ